MTPANEFIMETLPEHVAATMEVRDEWFRKLPKPNSGLEFVVSDVQKWRPGQRIRVAFLSGTLALHRQIVDATREITDACDLTLDFGFNADSGLYRSWTENDQDYSAEIRVSFDQGGYFSLVGTDSIDPGIGSPNEAVGGRPHQRSLNLGGFHVRKPIDWEGTVRHEFLHALAFHHEHQNMRGPCETSFRWDDDPNYEPTPDINGMYVEDSRGRRPGIYTYLAGYPNFWSKAKVNHNLRTGNDPDVVAGVFDPQSVMLYRFPEIFYGAVPSPCAPTGDGSSLSEGDKRGLRLLYPPRGPESTPIEKRRAELLNTIQLPVHELRGAESDSPAMSDMTRRVAGILLRTLPH